MSFSVSIRGAGTLAAIGAAVILATTTHSQADDGIFESWTTVSEDVLAEERGRNVVIGEELAQAGGALAINYAEQTVTNTINGDAPAGNLTMAPYALANQKLVINSFNTAPNAVIINQLSIAVDMTTPAP